MKMRFIGWAEAFKEEKPLQIDFVQSVHRLEVSYWIWMGVGLMVFIYGLALLGFGSDRLAVLGLVLAVSGMLDIVLIKIWVHIRLAMYWILWDHRQSIAAELRRSQAADL